VFSTGGPEPASKPSRAQPVWASARSIGIFPRAKHCSKRCTAAKVQQLVDLAEQLRHEAPPLDAFVNAMRLECEVRCHEKACRRSRSCCYKIQNCSHFAGG